MKCYSKEEKRQIKIAKFTLNGYFNYGNLLQSYALQQILMKYAIKVDTICLPPIHYLPITWWRWSWKNPIKFILNWRGFRNDMLSGNIGFEMSRQVRMRDFALKHITQKFDVDLTTIDKQYDFCVVGSDQVWNPIVDNIWNHFLPFVSKEKRISYAASIAVPEIPNNIKSKFISSIMGMKTLSIREQEGAELVEKMTGRKAEVHVDPTFLLTADDWRKLSYSPVWKKNKFLLTYFLGNRPKEIDDIATSLNLEVVNLLDCSSYDYYTINVEEFLWAIDNASLVYTDSFHGCVFSILFNTPFVVCNRKHNSEGNVTEKMRSRIDTLLKKFNFESRRGTKDNNYRIKNYFAEIDWKNSNDLIKKERIRSYDYLGNVLRIDT